MATHYIPEFQFVLVDKTTGKFPKIDSGLNNEKRLTDSLGETYIFDDRDSQDLKIIFYNAVYKGTAEFESFVF